MSKNRTRKVLRSILIMCEGEAEKNFLDFIKREHIPREAGFKLTIKNAHGKGAKHVIDHTIRLKRFSYDAMAAFFDTDKDWSQQEKSKADKEGIKLFPSHPCFEAEILTLQGIDCTGLRTDDIKVRFLSIFVAEAHKVKHAEVLTDDILATALLDKGCWFDELYQWLIRGGST